MQKATGFKFKFEFKNFKFSKMLKLLNDDDMFIITADHGCDPSTPSTDHSRENVPYLCYVKSGEGENLGTIEGFDFIAKTVYKYLTGSDFEN